MDRRNGALLSLSFSLSFSLSLSLSLFLSLSFPLAFHPSLPPRTTRLTTSVLLGSKTPDGTPGLREREVAHRGQQSRNRLYAGGLSRAGSTVGRRDLIAINVPPWSFRSRGRGHHHLPVADPIGKTTTLESLFHHDGLWPSSVLSYCLGKGFHNKSHILRPALRSMATGFRAHTREPTGLGLRESTHDSPLSYFGLHILQRYRPMYIFYRKLFVTWFTYCNARIRRYGGLILLEIPFDTVDSIPSPGRSFLSSYLLFFSLSTSSYRSYIPFVYLFPYCYADPVRDMRQFDERERGWRYTNERRFLLRLTAWH